MTDNPFSPIVLKSAPWGNQELEREKERISDIAKPRIYDKIMRIEKTKSGFKVDTEQKEHGEECFEVLSYYYSLQSHTNVTQDDLWFTLPDQWQFLMPNITRLLTAGGQGKIYIHSLLYSKGDDKNNYFTYKTEIFDHCQLNKVFVFDNIYGCSFTFATYQVEQKVLDMYGVDGNNKPEGVASYYLDLLAGEAKRQ